MSDVKLKSGEAVAFDFYKITYREVREFLDAKRKDDEVFAMMARLSGKDANYFESLPWPDFRKVATAFWEGINDPNAESSSVSASTGESSTTEDRQN